MDPELDDLLNDALADFDKPPAVPETSKTKDGTESENRSKDQKSGNNASAQMAPPSDVFRQFFDENMTKRLEQEWQCAIEELKCDDPALATHLEKLSTTLDTSTAAMASDDTQTTSSSQTTSTAKETDSTEPINLEKIMKDTISGLEKSADEIKNMSKDEAEEKLFSEMNNLGLGGGMGDMMGGMGDMMGGLDGDFMQMMEGMMQNLLSKDVLYPTMKEISKAYPDWLNENEKKLSPDELTRYKKQQTLINKICESFEVERDDDTQEVKRRRLNETMLLVEQMQECGNPPQDLIEKCTGDSSVDVEKFFGVGGLAPNPFKPGGMNPDGCCVM